MHEKLTIQDIARLAGVSKATVSRVLNHKPVVSAEVHERVTRIIAENGFVPNATAIQLAGGRKRLIGVLAPPLTWPALPEILRGVAEYIEQTSYEIVLYSISFERDHADVLERILGMRMISGLLAILPGELSRHVATHFEQGLPLVMIDDQEQPGAVPWVGIDNVVGAYQATRYLLDLGYRRIAHLRGPEHYYCAQERYQGYCQALQDAGLNLDPSLLLQGQFDTPSGRRSASEFFAHDKSTWPDALFVGNDQMAYGVLETLEKMGARVPEDIAIVGFDDNLLSAYMRPPLTTIHQPFFQMGSTAIELLLTMIDPEHSAVAEERKDSAPSELFRVQDALNQGHPPRILLPTRLVVRASS
ncbi:MAG TPA: LacI family DNA-binding transcriptional regulator [Ktedonobacteraceae bacterium]|jgi:LacI family transcriptional regulator